MSDQLVVSLEAELRTLAFSLTQPHQRECSLCYAERMTVAFGCDGTLRWVNEFVRRRAPQVGGFQERAAQAWRIL